MSLLSLDILEGKTSKYETNHIHMIVDGEISFPVTNMNNKQYSTFFHEYIHYVQHLTTLFGVKICTMYNKMFILYVDYLRNNKEVKLPLELWKENNGLMNFISTFNNIKGDKSCIYRIDEVEISLIEISAAKNNRCAVQIGLYDFENDKAIEHGFKFGYTCIIESMAHLIQSLINEELYHSTIPYCSAELIFKTIYAEKSHDKKMIISLCFCSLMFDNPGVAFFEMINYSKNNPELNGYEIYKKLIKDHSVKYNGEEMPMYRTLCMFLDEFKVTINQAIGCELNYYDKVIENCKNEIKSASNVLLDILYNADISDKRCFQRY